MGKRTTHGWCQAPVSGTVIFPQAPLFFPSGTGVEAVGFRVAAFAVEYSG